MQKWSTLTPIQVDVVSLIGWTFGRIKKKEMAGLPIYHRRSKLTFVSNNKEGRTYDSDRGIELCKNGGGSSGALRFILRGSDFELPFNGRISSEPISGVDPSLPAPQSTTLIWNISAYGVPAGMTKEEVQEVIRDAMTSYKAVYGYPSEQRVRVRFV